MKWAFFTIVVLTPSVSYAQVAQFVFTSSAQSIAVGAISETLTVQAQSAGGTSQSISQTGCLQVESTSASGQFSTSATNWEAVSVITMNSGTANKNFYYKDSTAGTFTLTVRAGLRPVGETKTCATLASSGEFPAIQWTATQSVSVTGSGGGPPTESSESTSSSTTTTSTSQTSTQTVSQTAPVSSYVAPPDPTLFADAGSDRTVIVGAHTEYMGRAYNKKKEPVENARFTWNFGDATTAEGASVLHRFEYPGKYAVVLTIAQNREAVSDRIVVTAEPAKLGFKVETDGSAVIENLSGRDLDLSSWIVRAFMRDFLLPEDTVVLSSASIRISPKTLGFFAGKEAILAYPNGVPALSADQASATAPAPPTIDPAPSPATVSAPARRPVVQISVAEADDTGTDVEDSSEPIVAASSSAQVAAAAVSGGYWWLGAFALAGISGATLFAVRRMQKTEWDIVEDSGSAV